MPREKEATDLGTQITRKNLNKKEMDERICKALVTRAEFISQKKENIQKMETSSI